MYIYESVIMCIFIKYVKLYKKNYNEKKSWLFSNDVKFVFDNINIVKFFDIFMYIYVYFIFYDGVVLRIFWGKEYFSFDI